MKVIVYSANPVEKKYLQAANECRHQFTFCCGPLNELTVKLADHFDVICISTSDLVSAAIIQKLKDLNIRFITIRSAGFENIDIDAAKAVGIHVANTPKPQRRLLFVKDRLSHMVTATLQNINCWAMNQVSENELMDPEPGGERIKTNRLVTST